MSEKITPFEYQGKKVRTVIISGEPWFVAKDVCEVLGISWRGHETLANIPDTWKGVRRVRTPSSEYDKRGGGIQELIIINEPALYKFSFRSNKPEADKFTNWVASEVLPAIRKTGTYSIHSTQPPFLYGSKSLSHVAEDDDALEKMFRKRKKGLIGIGFDKSVAVRKSLESILEGTGVDLSVRWRFSHAELGETKTPEKGHKNVSPEPERADTKVLSEIPEIYRDYHLNQRGKNKKEEPIFNLVRKVNGKRFQKYLGVWNQEKADRIIDELNSLIETNQDK